MNIPFAFIAKRFLHSFSQVMLQENVITGLLFLLGIGLNSPTMLLGSLMATVSALVVAKLCKYDLNAMNSGLYGFNAALVGIAVFYFLPVSLTSLVFIIFGGAFSSLLMHFMTTKLANIPALTTPFILTTWLMLIIIDYAGGSTIAQSPFDEAISITFVDYVLGVFRGIGQVMLQESWLSGAIFLCALAFNPAKAAIWALTGSLVGMLIAVAFSFSAELALMGIYGFNSCLVAIALAARYPKKYWLIIFGILVSVLLTRVFEQVSLPALTAPFVMTTWLIFAMIKLQNNFTKQSNIEQGLG